jgi:GT2 family glycosyltransferase
MGRVEELTGLWNGFNAEALEKIVNSTETLVTIAMLSYRRHDVLLESLKQYIQYPLKFNICLRVQGAEEMPTHKRLHVMELMNSFEGFDVQFTRGNHGTGVPRYDVVERALNHFDTPYIATFDDDILWPRNGIEALLCTLADNHQLGGTALWCKGNYPAWYLEGKYMRSRQPQGPLDIVTACGSGTKIVKREVFEKVPLDPNFYIGWADMCWGYEVNKAGWHLGILAIPHLIAINQVVLDPIYFHTRYNQHHANKSWGYFRDKHGIEIVQ